MKNRTMIKRLLALVFIVFGLALGVTWNKENFCIGDKMFAAIGLPAWSSGTSGTHYPAVIGTIVILLGIAVLNSTFPEKFRRWTWIAIALILAALSLLFSIV